MMEWLAKLEPKWIATNIIGWAAAGVIFYCYFFYIAVPTQERTFLLMDKVIETQTKIADTQAKQQPILDRIDRNTSK